VSGEALIFGAQAALAHTDLIDCYSEKNIAFFQSQYQAALKQQGAFQLEDKTYSSKVVSADVWYFDITPSVIRKDKDELLSQLQEGTKKLSKATYHDLAGGILSCSYNFYINDAEYEFRASRGFGILL